MVAEDQSKSSTDHFRLRQCILETLYGSFKKFPYAAIELRQIEEACQTDAATLNWNIVYLEKCGFVELGKSVECPPYVASSAAITAKGIDLVEDKSELKRRFSSQQPDQA